jgi:hypothetical protein
MIVGTTHIDYFAITCADCGSETQNEYLGWDPVMPQFAANCPKAASGVRTRCGTTLGRVSRASPPGTNGQAARAVPRAGP